MSKSLGIPVKLLHEAEGHIVTVELKSGDVYRGSLIECEDNWNCQLEAITYTSKVQTHHKSIPNMQKYLDSSVRNATYCRRQWPGKLTV